MAVRTDLADDIKNHASAPSGTEWDENWDGHTGLEVESFITEKLKANEDSLIVGASYAGTTLTLNKKSGDPITCQVVVAEPQYTYGIMAYGLVLDDNFDTIYKTATSLTTQYTSSKTFKLGVVVMAYTTVVSTSANLTTAQSVNVSFGTKTKNYRIIPTDYQKVLVDGEGNVTGVVVANERTDITWLDITDLFKEAQSGQLSVKLDVEGVDIQHTLPIGTIINEVVNLKYSAKDYICGTTSAEFETDSDNTNYYLSGWVVKNGGAAEVITASGMQYTNMAPGLNQFLVCAVNKQNANVRTDYIAVDLICTVGLTTPVTAVNGVNSTIANNGVATLYKLTVYSPTGEDEVKISTYISETDVDKELLTDSQLVKADVLSATSYTENDKHAYNSQYQKYMEISGGGSQFLYIKSGNSWYQYLNVYENQIYFTTSKSMIVETLDTKLIYHSNGVSKSFDQIKGCLNDIFKTAEYYPSASNINPDMEVSDGWVEDGGRNIFRVSAQESSIFKTPLDINLQDNFTLEFGIKTYNISDEHEPIIKIGNLHIRPTTVCWNVNKSATDELNDTTYTYRNSPFQSDTEIHIMITVKKNAQITDEGNIYYPDYFDYYESELALNKLNQLSINLMRIFINGVIDREIILTQADMENLKSAKLDINPKGSDCDFYVVRIYDHNDLDFSQVQKNYISFLRDKSSKLAFYNANNILGSNGEISFAKSMKLYNTIVYVLPSGCKTIESGQTNDKGRFPNRAWGYADNNPGLENVMKKARVACFVNYVDAAKNKVYGGRLNRLQIKPQGSSARRYLIWNVASTLNKFDDKSEFVPYSNLDGTTNKFKAKADRSGVINAYIMPKYSGELDKADYKAEKLVGKVNFASSMQSHKQGACRLFDDAFKNANPMPQVTTDYDPQSGKYGSKKGVHEEAFLYFYWEPENMDNDAVDEVELADVLAAGQNVKFMGFHTWGPAKKDKAYYGSSKNTPEMLLIEGGENKDPLCNFRVPWHAIQRANSDNTVSNPDQTELTNHALMTEPTTPYDPTKSHLRLVLSDESICYSGTTETDGSVKASGARGAWDVDFGADDWISNADDTIILNTIKSKCYTTLNKFRAFHDFVYSHDFTFKFDNTVSPSTDNWKDYDTEGKLQPDTSHKYVVKSTTSPIEGYTNHHAYDIYRYEEYSGKWVPAGVSYDLENHRWNPLNLADMSGVSFTFLPDVEMQRERVKQAFQNGIGDYVVINDIAFHQAFIKLLSGTDNRAKNTYYQIPGPVYDTEMGAEYNAKHNFTDASQTSGYMVAQDEVLYTAEDNLPDGKNVGDVKTPAITLEEADAYNTAHSLTSKDKLGYCNPTKATGNYIKRTATTVKPVASDAYKIRLIGDDLDTIFVTDNNGLQSKPYNLLEASYYEPDRKHWGDANNIFYYMFDQCFEQEIKTLLKVILNYAFANNNDVTNPANYFYAAFFDIQDNQFPAVAYNHTAKIYYENAEFIKSAGVINVYANNEIEHPLTQSHGSSVSGEKLFMQKRFDFLSSYVLKDGGDDNYAFSDTSGGAGISSARLLLEFEPYQDFYPNYFWGHATSLNYLAELDKTSNFDACKYLARTGNTYNTEFQVNLQGINNAIRLVSLYKKLTITGMQNHQLSASFKHMTEFTMDNANYTVDADKYPTTSSLFFKDWPEMALNDVTATMPVLEELNLRNMELPSQLDISKFGKLKKADFSGTNVKYVILPQSGRLQTVILPDTIEEFRIYNNPGLRSYVNDEETQSGIILSENLDNLRTVYIVANKCGNFEVLDFINKIANLSLTDCTLRNVDIKITQETLIGLLKIPSLYLTGRIQIISEEDATAEAPISFSTLQTLVNKFGNINSETNSLYVKYKKEAISIVKAPATLSMYGVGSKASVAPIIDSGNNVVIVDNGDGTARLNITYALKGTNSASGATFDTSVATIDSTTGEITLKKESTKLGYVYITIKTDNGDRTNNSSNSCEVSFVWSAPKLGDFAYSDGTFSSSYIASKTLVGLVYAVTATTSTSGTAYIIGKEYASDTAYLFGYSGEGGELNASQYSVSAYYLNRYVKTILGITDNDYTGAGLGIDNLQSMMEGEITKATYENSAAESNNDHFSGKADTTKYINMVDQYGLPAIYQKYNSTSTNIRTSLKDNGDGTYSIKDMTGFTKVYRELASIKVGSDDVSNYSQYKDLIANELASAVIFPYVYAIHLYQPEVGNNTLDLAYTIGNWYVPSLNQLQRVLYYRGVSALDSFTDPNAVRRSIDGTATSTNAIFSKAFTVMGSSNFPQCWDQIVGSGASATSGGTSNANNLVTTFNSTTGNNYAYQYTGGSNSYSGSNSYTNKWQYGEMPSYSGSGYYSYSYASYPGSYNAWRLYSSGHRGIPFVEYNYAKPS